MVTIRHQLVIVFGALVLVFSASRPLFGAANARASARRLVRLEETVYQPQRPDSPAPKQTAPDSQPKNPDTGAARTSATSASVAADTGASKSEVPASVNNWPILVAAGLFLIPLLIAVFRFFDAITTDGGARIESNWGGFGGGMGGWRFSPALMYFLTILLFGGLFTTMVYLWHPDAAADKNVRAPAAQQSTAKS